MALYEEVPLSTHVKKGAAPGYVHLVLEDGMDIALNPEQAMDVLEGLYQIRDEIYPASRQMQEAAEQHRE